MSYTVEFWALPQTAAADIAQATDSATTFGETVREAGVYFGWVGHSSSSGEEFRSALQEWGARLGLPLEAWIIGPNPDLPFPAPEDPSGYPSVSGFTSAQAAELFQRLEPMLDESDILDESVLDVEALLSVALDARDRHTDITTVYW